jgi:hypothetical protein
MSLVHLEGKRTGRRPGSRNSSRWKRDLLWAWKNLGNPDAEPPSPLAGLLLAMGRSDPANFLFCLSLLEVQTLKLEVEAPKAEEQKPVSNDTAPNVLAPKADGFRNNGQPRRLKRVRVREDSILSSARMGNPNCQYFLNVPNDAHIVACEADIPHRELHVVITSEKFPEVAEGEPIPEVELEPRPT